MADQEMAFLDARREIRGYSQTDLSVRFKFSPSLPVRAAVRMPIPEAA